MHHPTPLSSRWRQIRRRLLVGCCCCFLGFALAAEPARRSFDLPSDGAEKTLKAFSSQAGVEVLFSSDAVAGVRTNVVKGDFTPLEAAKKMLAGTALYVRDQSNGVIIVATTADPHADPKAERAAPTEKSARPPAPIPANDERKPPPRSPPDAGANPQEAVVLSPFVVASSQDTGYQGTSTLAGTRLNTSLKDIGASISIYTKEFLSDLGATSANELLIYATGMEAAGAQGNFSGATNDINALQVVGDSVRAAPQNGSRSRGLSSPTYTRDLFASNIPIDSYNTDTVTVSRGPNAALFGVGSPAGVVDTALLQANLKRNRSQFAFRVGNNDSLRATLDLGRVLVPGRLAFRIAAVDDHEKFNQRPAFEHKRRIFGTLTAKPTRTTTLRAKFESGNTTANRPLGVLPFNSISRFWYEAGKPVFDWTRYDDPAKNPSAAAQNAQNFVGFLFGQAQVFNAIAIVYDRPDAPAPSNSFRTFVLHTNAGAANSVRQQLFHPLVNRDSSPDQIAFFGTFNIASDNAIPAAFYPDGRVPAGQKVQGFTDFEAFDFKNRMLDETSRQGDSFRTGGFALEQLLWENRAGLELAYNGERYDSHSINSLFQGGNNNHIRLDPNVTLPTGQPNPNVGRPYTLFNQATWGFGSRTRESARATAFLRYDFKDANRTLGKWLGRHTLTGLYERVTADTVTYGTRLYTAGPAADAIAPTINNFSRLPAVILYLGPSVLGDGKLQLEPVRVTGFRPGLTVPTTYFAAPAGSPAQGDFTTAETTLQEINNGGSAQREVIRSRAAVLQSYWLADHLVTTFGWRRDQGFVSRTNFDHNSNPAKVHYGLGDFSFPSTPPLLAEKDVRSYGAVLRWPRKWLPLPRGFDLGVFTNYSENFTPQGGRLDVYGNSLPAPVGQTREYGLNFWTPGDRLFVRINRFETKVAGQSLTPQVLSIAYNNGVLQRAQIWATERNINPHIDRTADMEALFSALPSGFRDYYQFQVTGDPANQTLAAAYVFRPPTDTTDFVAKGTELDLTFTPNSRWRLLFNLARQETVQSNIVPGTKDFIARIMPAWQKLADLPAGNYPQGHVLGTPLPANVLTMAQWVNTNITSQYATAIATEGSASPEQRRWRANLVVNYTFPRESRLRGWNTGVGVRWQDKIAIGYPFSYLTPERNSGVKVDIAHPYYASGETNADAWVGYGRKLWRDRIGWKFQLNVRNLVGQSGAIPITAQPTGATAVARLAPERRWYITNTFDF